MFLKAQLYGFKEDYYLNGPFAISIQKKLLNYENSIRKINIYWNTLGLQVEKLNERSRVWNFIPTYKMKKRNALCTNDQK